MPMVQGWCDPAFKTAQDAFAASFEDRVADQDREHGAALAAIVDGKMVVDLWGGWADKAATRPDVPDKGLDGYRGPFARGGWPAQLG